MDLTGLTIPDIYGVDRIPLKGEYDADSLAQKFIDEWIPYHECEKCGRSDYCKYTKPDPYRADRLADIKCGVIVDAIRNFVKYTFHLLYGITRDQIQDYIDGAFHLEQFLYDAEQTTGTLIDEGILKWLDHYAPLVVRRATHLREHLNLAASRFRNIPKFLSKKGILFVEGWSENAFLEKLRESHYAHFLDLKIEVYEGRANRRPRRIQMLLDRYVKQGYLIYIQGDADGSKSDIFRALKKKGSVTPEHTFFFCHDFESSVPSDILYRSIQSLGELSGVSEEEFAKVVRSEDKSVIKIIKQHYHLDLEPLKLPLATAIAHVLNNPRFCWWSDEDFMKTELGKFLHFIRKIE